jgi:hypothetical protein
LRTVSSPSSACRCCTCWGRRGPPPRSQHGEPIQPVSVISLLLLNVFCCTGFGAAEAHHQGASTVSGSSLNGISSCY